MSAATNYFACMGLSTGPSSIIGFSGQSNIVIWDPNTQIEHFVRTASFSSNVEDFEFIAPTPSVPELSSVDRKCFDLLHSLTGSKVQAGGLGGGAGFGGGGGGVSVIQEKQVGSLSAATLLATDSAALKKWLEDNEYKVSQTQQEWLDHYINLGWYLTAFKYNSKKKSIQSEAIRMSFKTDMPYNPYYVPKENWSNNARLELFLISSVPLEGFVGKNQKWRPVPTHKLEIKDTDIEQLLDGLKLRRSDFPLKCKLTRYVDSDFAKGVKEDLFFHRVPN